MRTSCLCCTFSLLLAGVLRAILRQLYNCKRQVVSARFKINHTTDYRAWIALHAAVGCSIDSATASSRQEILSNSAHDAA